MNRVILFSPVGGTDPIPQTNFKDGSLLHICRVYKPTDVYLYMSAEILKLHEQDDRYMYCLERLAKLQGREMNYQVIARPALCNVQFFDTFYQDFREVIQSITADMDETDQLLFNVSSGTPAMKSGLVVLATLGEYPYRLIQVRTPVGSMNEHRHEDYDVKSLWELDEDNEDGFENRCQEITCPSLSILKQEEIIKKLVEEYDYEAAKGICDMLPESATQNYRLLIEMACARLRLDLKKVKRLEKETGMECMPVRDSDKIRMFEYALGMDVKRKKKEYTDFIRSITPLILELFLKILKHKCGIDIIKDFSYRRKNWGRKWDRKRLAGTDIDAILQKEYYHSFNYSDIYSGHLAYIIQEKCAEDSVLCRKVEDMRGIEEVVRNPAAHELVSLSNDGIKGETGYDAESIMNLFKSLFQYAGFGIRREEWDSYDTMNKNILQRMNQC